MLDSGMINKIQKARTYATEPDRIHFQSLKVEFDGNNGNHEVQFEEGHWRCDCGYFHSHGTSPTPWRWSACSASWPPTRWAEEGATPCEPAAAWTRGGRFRFYGRFCLDGRVWACPRLRWGRAAAP